MSELKKRFLDGEPLDIPLYDIHAHLGEYNRDYPVFYGRAGEIANEMDRVGIVKAVVVPLGIYGTEVSFQNDKLIHDCKTYPGKFVGFPLVNLNNSHVDIEKELERCRKAGLHGIKLIAAYQNSPGDGKNVEFVCEYADHHKLPILNHSWVSTDFLEKMVKKYPRVEYICGHFGFAWKEIVNAYDNVWLCTCNWLAAGTVDEMVKEIRTDRICWGSDFSDLEIGFTLGPILLSDIDDATKKKILGENTAAFLEKTQGGVS